MANKNKSENWNYHPDLPLVDTSIFNSPTNPKLLAFWFSKNWLTLSERVLMVILAVMLWFTVYLSLESAETWAFGWLAQTWVVNMILVFCVARRLHWFLHEKGQGAKLKFSNRDLMRNNHKFSFRDQVKNNMFWSLTTDSLNCPCFRSSQCG